MKSCLRCNGPCKEDSAFCERCQCILLKRTQNRDFQTQADQQPSAKEPAQMTQKLQSARQRVPVRESVVSYSSKEAPDAAFDAIAQNTTTPSSSPQNFSLARAFIQPVSAHSRSKPKTTASRRLRTIFVVLAVLAILGVLVDGSLVALTLLRVSHGKSADAFSPLMVLSSNVVSRGDTVTVHLSHCEPFTQMFLTRDLQESLQMGRSQPPLNVDLSGNVTVLIKIDDSWKPGSHQIVAEDVQTHYTAYAPLYVSGPTSIIPPRLQVNQTTLDMGSDTQWKNTAHSLVLSNAGSGSISWIASSNQPWLSFSPAQGVFSDEQQLFIAASRAHLKPGQYDATITLVSNASGPVLIHVTMSVLPLTDESASVLGINQALLSFATTDGNSGDTQNIMISNPGLSPLTWSMESNVAADAAGQQAPFLANTNWLSLQSTAGTVASATTAMVPVTIHSQNLLPGVYIRILTFAGDNRTLASPQTVIVTLTVRPHCGVVTNTESMSFTAVAGQSAPVTQALGLSLASGCLGPIAWRANALTNWLSIAPDNGLVQQDDHSEATVAVKADKLAPGLYTGYIVFFTVQRTDMILVQLTVQAAGSGKNSTLTNSAHVSNGGNTTPGTGTLSVSSSQLTFNVVQGTFALQNQAVTISNAGGGTLSWQAHVRSNNAPWLNVTPAQGTLASTQNEQLTVSANVVNMQPGSYQAQVVITPVNAGGATAGGEQMLTIVLNVLPPCMLEVSPTKLAFSSSLLQPDPPGQSITLKDTGGCMYPISWVVSTDDGNQGWIQVSPPSGSDRGMGNDVTVNVNTKGMLLGRYNGSITISAFDNKGNPVMNSTQTIPITLTVVG